MMRNRKCLDLCAEGQPMLSDLGKIAQKRPRKIQWKAGRTRRYRSPCVMILVLIEKSDQSSVVRRQMESEKKVQRGLLFVGIWALSWEWDP
jgi:hypothetical protein